MKKYKKDEWKSAKYEFKKNFKYGLEKVTNVNVLFDSNSNF